MNNLPLLLLRFVIFCFLDPCNCPKDIENSERTVKSSEGHRKIVVVSSSMLR